MYRLIAAALARPKVITGMAICRTCLRKLSQSVTTSWVSYLVGNQPSQTAKMMMNKRAGKEGRHRKADHREHRAGLIEPGILPVRGIDTDWHRDQDADEVGGADDGQGLRHTLTDDGEDRAARLPGQDALFAFGPGGAEPAVEQGGGFDPEELPQPQDIAHEDGLIGAQRLDHLLADVRRHGQRNFGQRRSGGQIDQQKDHQADDQQRRDGQKKPAKREG